MVIDTLDALDHPAGYDEFILISADADLTPVLLRSAPITATPWSMATRRPPPPTSRSPTAMIDATRFAAVLAGDGEPAPSGDAATAVRWRRARRRRLAVAADRNDIESLARKVHATTNVPMFSPRTFADLFRVLAQEIGEHGYHFQNTAENVTDKLVAAGRNANRRQVMFVVKGLALKGHVFSTTDTPERLAEVFREQVSYLIDNSGLELDEREKAMLPNWIIGRTPPVVAKAPPAATPPKPAPPPKNDPAKKPTPIRRRVTRPAGKEEEAAPAPAPAARAERRRRKPAPPPSPSLPPRGGRRRPPAHARRQAGAAGPGVGGPSPASRTADVRASVASRFAAITKGTFSTKPSGETTSKPRPVARPAASETSPATPRTPPPRPTAATAGRPANGGSTPARPTAAKAATKPTPSESDDALESSILAAIAQAVDVLVDDNDATTKARDSGDEIEMETDTVEVSPAPPSQPEPPPDPDPSPGRRQRRHRR